MSPVQDKVVDRATFGGETLSERHGLRWSVRSKPASTWKLVRRVYPRPIAKHPFGNLNSQIKYLKIKSCAGHPGSIWLMQPAKTGPVLPVQIQI